MSLGMLLWVVAAMAQESGSPGAAPPSTMQMTMVGTSLKASDGKIYVNANCEIFPGLTLPLNSHKPKGEWIPEVCHVENVEQSEQREEKPVGSELERVQVEIREQEYVLQNIGVKPEVFEVLEEVPEGWSVDSDPEPEKMDGRWRFSKCTRVRGRRCGCMWGLRHTRS